MAITSLERAALINSQEFTNQVNDVVLRETLYKVDTLTGLDATQQGQLKQVMDDPARYKFAETITASSAWTVKYDVWAADPPAQDGAITSAVDQYFGIKTGFYPPAP